MARWFKAKALRPDRGEPGSGTIRARPSEIAAWLGIATVWTAVWCWLSVLLAERFAPVIVLPVLTGLVLAAGYVAAMRLVGLGSRRWLLSCTLVLSLALTAGQHLIWYRITQAKVEESYSTKLSGNKLGALVATIPELHPDFAEFMRSTAARGRAWFTFRLYGGWVWASWALDAFLQSVAAVGFIWFATRPIGVRAAANVGSGGTTMQRVARPVQPYCDRCRSWYRTVRQGNVNADKAAAVARLCGREGFSPSGQYRLLGCQSGCGPAFLELIGARRGERCEAWLDEPGRRQLLDLLDHETTAAGREPEPPTAQTAEAGPATDPSAVENPQ